MIDKYQYYTKARMGKLWEVGYHKPFMDIEAGFADYVCSYLDKDYKNY